MAVQIFTFLFTVFKRQKGGEALACSPWDSWDRAEGQSRHTPCFRTASHLSSSLHAVSVLQVVPPSLSFAAPQGMGHVSRCPRPPESRAYGPFHTGRSKSSPSKSICQHLEVFLCQRCFINSLLLQTQHLIPVCPLATLDPTAMNTSVSAHPARNVSDIFSYKIWC